VTKVSGNRAKSLTTSHFYAHKTPRKSAKSLSANVRDDGELVVLASSPAWAAKLRFEADSLMAAARQSGANVTSFKVRVSRES
jgi:hypothetical protein